MTPGRIGALARVEFIRLVRTRITFTLLVVVPLLQVVLFGLAIRPDGRVTVAIGAPVTADAARVAKEIGRESNLHVVGTGGSGSAEASVRDGRALVGIEVPPTRSLANPFVQQRPVRVIVDATNPALTNAAAARVETAYWRAIIEREELSDTGPGFSIERLHNPAGRADWTFLAGLVGVTVMIAMAMLGALSLARERDAGTWEGLLSLPFHPAELIAGKALPHVAIGTVQGVGVLAIAIFAFDLPATGSVAALLALLPLFATAHFVLGYAIAARAPSQLAALQGAVAFYLPAMLLSGFLYPFATLPGWAQTLGETFPLTHFIRASHGALLRGEGAAAVLGHGVPIGLALVAMAALALAMQSRRLDAM